MVPSKTEEALTVAARAGRIREYCMVVSSEYGEKENLSNCFAHLHKSDAPFISILSPSEYRSQHHQIGPLTTEILYHERQERRLSFNCHAVMVRV